MQLPVQLAPQLPDVEPVVDAVTGLATAAAQLPFAPITLPVVVAPVGAGGAGGGGAGGAGGAGPRPGSPSVPEAPGAPRAQPAPERPAPQNTPPAYGVNYGGPPESFRVGYGDYLRSAGTGQLMAVAVPGIAGILVLTAAGGLLGYRQARAGHTVRGSGTSRFMG